LNNFAVATIFETRGNTMKAATVFNVIAIALVAAALSVIIVRVGLNWG
jgi:hypothetical protein